VTQTLKHGILKHIAPIHSKESLSALHWVSEWTDYVVHYCQQPLMRWMHWLKKNDGSEVTVQHTHTHTNDTGTALRGPRSGVCVVQTPVSGDITGGIVNLLLMKTPTQAGPSKCTVLQCTVAIHMPTAHMYTVECTPQPLPSCTLRDSECASIVTIIGDKTE